MQNTNPKSGQVYVSEPVHTDEVHIHVTGDMMPRTVFFEILELMKTYLDKKTIVFDVYHHDMMRLVRESVPSQFYKRIELFSPKAFETREGLRRAG